MANFQYLPHKELALALSCGVGDLPSGTLSAVLVDVGSYAADPAHEFLSSVGAGIVGNPATINAPTFTDGVLAGSSAVFLLPSGPSVEALVICLYTGVLAESRLVAFMDSGITGLPFTPSGDLNYSVSWGPYIFGT